MSELKGTNKCYQKYFSLVLQLGTWTNNYCCVNDLKIKTPVYKESIQSFNSDHNTLYIYIGSVDEQPKDKCSVYINKKISMTALQASYTF